MLVVNKIKRKVKGSKKKNNKLKNTLTISSLILRNSSISFYLFHSLFESNVNIKIFFQFENLFPN